VFPRCADRSRCSRALIILVGQPVVVELGLLDRGICATPVVSGLGGESIRGTPSLKSSKAPTGSTHTLIQEKKPLLPSQLSTKYISSSRHNSPPAPPPLRGRVENIVATARCCLSLLPPHMSCPGHRLIRTLPPVPSPCGLRCQGVACLACVFPDNPCTPPKALISMVGTDEGRGWVGK
jgi:hypothetical protein